MLIIGVFALQMLILGAGGLQIRPSESRARAERIIRWVPDTNSHPIIPQVTTSDCHTNGMKIKKRCAQQKGIKRLKKRLRPGQKRKRLASATVGTNAFDHIISRGHLITLRQVYGGNGDMVETESGVTPLTEKMHMRVVVDRMTMMMAVTQLVAGTAGIVDDMHQPVLLEDGKGAKHPRLVDGEDPLLQLGQRERALGGSQRPEQHDTVGRRLHRVFMKYLL